MSDTTLSVVILAPAPLWTSNAQRRMHWARRNEQWRFTAKLEAMNARLPAFESVDIEARIVRTSKRKADADAFAPTIKACLDGLVDAKVLEDDGPDYVRSVTYVASEAGMADSVVLTLRGQLRAE